jgi:hypothetical protein
VAAALLAGCGGDGGAGGDSGGGGSATPQTVDGVRACLAKDDRYSEVEKLTATTLDGVPGKAVEAATKDATGALVVHSGGPHEEDGTITEAPVVVDELYFFADEAAATGAADALEPAVETVDAVGRVVVVRYAFGIGDRPEQVALSGAPLERIERCASAAGFA